MKNQKTFLVIGASGTLGSVIVQVLREIYPSSFILGTYNNNRQSLGNEVDAAIQLDLNKKNWLETVRLSQPSLEKFDMAFFAFAKGAVGFPAHEATTKQLGEAWAISALPLFQLEKSGLAKEVVAFGAFHELPILKLVYGAMLITKEKIKERWTGSISPYGVVRHYVRLGGFMSTSFNSIKRALQEQLLLRKFNDEDILCKIFNDLSVVELREELLYRIKRQEQLSLCSNKMTDRKDLSDIMKVFLQLVEEKSNQGVILSGVGNLLWEGLGKPPNQHLSFTGASHWECLEFLAELRSWRIHIPVILAPRMI
ncbi:MAG: hypothetical protein AAB657_01100 [Patescibacteria group bacterium]